MRRRKWITPPTTWISTVEGRRRVHAFSYVLGYSRRQYLHFVDAARTSPTTIRQHIRAFEYLGGVAASCLYDNMKVVVSGYVRRRARCTTRGSWRSPPITVFGQWPAACGGPRPKEKSKGHLDMST